MTPDVSSKTLKDKRLPLHVVGQRAAAQKRFQGLKGLGALLMLVFLLFILHRFGPTATKHLQPAALQDAFHSAGEVGGIFLYVLAFCVGELLHLPGILFVSAGVLVWGRLGGWLLGILTAPIAITVPFIVVRRFGGQGMLGEIRLPLFKRILEKLDDRPFLTVVMLRCCFVMAPPATYALALSSVSARTYFLGSFVGLIGPVTVMVLFLDKFLAFMGIEVPDPATAEVSAAAEALSTVMTAAVVEGSQSLNQAGVLAGVALRKLLSTRR